MSKFDAVRARWEPTHQHQRGDPNSPSTLPLLRSKESFASLMLPNKQDRGAQPSGHARRMTTGLFSKPLSGLNRPLNSFNKTFGKNTRLSEGDMATYGDAKNEQAAKAREALAAKGYISGGSGKENSKLPRSQTMSLLPVPSKPTGRRTPAPPPTKSASKPILRTESRIPSPLKSTRPKHLLPRSTTTPNLGTSVLAPRRASEFPRRISSRYPPPEDTRPLLRTPLLESPMLNTPNRRDDGPTNDSPKALGDDAKDDFTLGSPTNPNLMWNALSTPRRAPGPMIGKENSGDRLPHQQSQMTPRNRSNEIHCRQLLQPIQPHSPASATIPGAFPDPSSAALGTTALYHSSLASDSRPVFTNRKNLQRPTPLILNPKPMASVHLVSTARPNTYWSGRFTSLNDRFLNEGFDTNTRPVSEDDVYSSAGSTASLIKQATAKKPESDEGKRAVRIFQELADCCSSEDAYRSLCIFRNMYAIRMNMPALKIAVPPEPASARTTGLRSDGSKDETRVTTLERESSSHTLSGSLRKMSFMERLRNRKSSAKSALGLRD